MDKVRIFAPVVGTIIIMLLLSGCVENKEENLNLTIEKISVEKTRYTANEIINFNVTIFSNKDLENVSVHVYGIKSRQGENLIDDVKILNITKGKTTMNYSVKAPYCTHGCGARYYPGEYALYAEVKYVEKGINFTSNMSAVVNLY